MSRCKLSEQNFENLIIRGRFSKKTHKCIENVPIVATSGRQNSANITDRRILTANINHYRISSFHFYRWNQLKLIPLPSTLRTRTFLPPKVSLLIIGCVLGTMRYICNHQVAPLTICIKQRVDKAITMDNSRLLLSSSKRLQRNSATPTV